MHAAFLSNLQLALFESGFWGSCPQSNVYNQLVSDLLFQWYEEHTWFCQTCNLHFLKETFGVAALRAMRCDVMWCDVTWCETTNSFPISFFSGMRSTQHFCWTCNLHFYPESNAMWCDVKRPTRFRFPSLGDTINVFLISERMDLFVADWDQSAVDQPNNLAEGLLLLKPR